MGRDSRGVDVMPEISDQEYNEYVLLKKHYGKNAIQDSINSITSLEFDIDVPIKRCVMMLSLLGLETMWSCCGFDYAGQPIHKSHQYDLTSFVIRYSDRSVWLRDMIDQRGMDFINYHNGWRIAYGEHYGRQLCYLSADTRTSNAWPDRRSIHYSEPAAIAIAHLEKFLDSLSGQFLNETIVVDTNDEFQKAYTWWQYPPRADWVIHRSDVV